jgi:hypothetical protein
MLSSTTSKDQDLAAISTGNTCVITTCNHITTVLNQSLLLSHTTSCSLPLKLSNVVKIPMTWQTGVYVEFTLTALPC